MVKENIAQKRELDTHQKRISTLETKYLKRQKQKTFNQGFYVYLVKSDMTELNKRYKIGKTKNLQDTIATYNRAGIYEYVFYMDCKSQAKMDMIEKFVHLAMDDYLERPNHEHFILPTHKTPEYFISAIRNAINAMNSTQKYGILC